jgi:FtsH-binding integral membrane protein
MDINSFYAIVSAINFTLLGLWWVAIKDRSDIRERDSAGRRMAYLVSLQFSVPGIIALLGQVAPDVPALWRSSFTFAALAGAVGVFLLGRSLRGMPGQAGLVLVFWWVAIPLYLMIGAVAAFEGIPDTLNLQLSSIEIEGLLLTMMVFLGVQTAWVVAMAPREKDEIA